MGINQMRKRGFQVKINGFVSASMDAGFAMSQILNDSQEEGK